MRLLPVYFPYDLSSCCSRQELAQKAQEFILCTGNINDCRVLFLHNTGDVPSNACRVHAVLLVMLHLTDAPGDAPAVFIIAENAFLTCFCKPGADVTQFYDGNMDAVGLDFVCKSVRVRRNGGFACRVEGLERNVRYGSNRADVHNMPLPLMAQEGENRFVYSDCPEKVHIKLCFGLLHGRKLHRTGNAKACTVDHCINFGLFLDDLLHSGVDRIFIGHIDRQMGDTLHRDTSAAELIDDAAVLFQRRCGAPSDAGASSGNNDDLIVFSHHDFPPENVDLVRVYRSAGRLSIPIAGLWKSTGINLRSREISACLVLQARSQLKAIYKDNADTIVGNMDSQIFLGGSEPTTLKDLAEALGKETIDSFNTSDTRGNSPSYGTSFQKLGHELMSRDELAVLDGGKCILQLRGVRPFLSEKYDLTQHPNYKLTADYDPKNTFDIEKYLHPKIKIHPSDAFVVVDADSLPPV